MSPSIPTELLRDIASLARSGRLDQASSEAAKAVSQYPDDPVLAALAGAIEFHRRQFLAAVTYLESALSHRPGDVTVRSNLIEALVHSGHMSRALQFCDDRLALSDPSLRLARLVGHLAQSSEEYGRAITIYRHIIERDPNDWSSWNNLGNALSGSKSYIEAAAALKRATELAPDAAPIRLNWAGALIDAERFGEAEEALRTAVDDFADDAMPLVSLADFYRRSGRDDDAFEALGNAVQRAPHDPQILTDYGQMAALRSDYVLAEKTYEAVLVHSPSLGAAIVGLASVYERTSRENALANLRERAVNASVDAKTIAFIDALVFKRNEQFDEALTALDQADDAVVLHRKNQLRGVILDRLRRYDEAFASFTAMNANRSGEPHQPLTRARAYREKIMGDQRELTPDWLERWAAFGPSDGYRSPVFLLGFPRSGTTLLDTMLMAAPNTLILEEQPFIESIERAMGGIAALSESTASQISAMREAYFANVATVGELGPDTVVIDKHPLHLNKVPVIRRLFPDAQFILALRHPCDVLLSCFITNFGANSAMSNFLTLETAAELYDLSFTSWTKSLALFEMPVHTVVYERLVADKDRELRPLFNALRLPWPGEGFDHRIAARERGVVSTASYAQVTEAIYTRSTGRWRQYQEHLAPIYAKLEPWIAQFGYAIEDERVPDWPAQPVALVGTA